MEPDDEAAHRPQAWASPPVPLDGLDRAERAGRPIADHEPGGVDAPLLAQWARLLCVMPTGSMVEVVEALRPGSMLAPAIGYQRVRPPPPGTSRMDVSDRDGELFTVRLTFAGNPVTRADLDAVFGDGRDVVRIHWDDPHPLSYRVEVPAAPHAVDIFADFPEQPTGGSVAIGVMLRRQRLKH